MLYFFFIFISLAQYVPHAFLKGKANRITISDVTVVEGNNLVFNVNLNRQAKANINITWSTANNSALAGTHYTASSGTLTILNGQSSGTITVSSVNHANVCANDVNFFVNLTSTSSGIISDGQGVGTIQDDDLPTLAIASAGDVTEGTNSVATVTLTPACNNKTVSFRATTTNGTATSGQDYTAQTNQLFSAAPGVTSVNIPIVTLDDVLDEDNSQNFTITISSPTNATIVTPSATMNILDNDVTPTISIAAALSTIEGTPLSAVVTLSGASEKTIGFNYATSNGTALSASGDYTAITSTAGTITPGATTTSIVLNALNDGVTCEADETFSFALSSITNALSGNLTSTITIIDFNKPTVTIADASGTEGSTLTFNVSLDFACPSNAMSFTYTTIDVSAASGSDYTFTSNLLTIPATQTTGSFTVATTNDTIREADSEHFLVTISALSYVKLGDDSIAQGTITDNETGEVTVQVVAGGERTCVVSSLGRVKCWGHKPYLGYNGGHYGDEPGEMGDALPSPDFGTNAANFGAPHTVLDADSWILPNFGNGVHCVRLDNNRVKCFGGISYSGSFGDTPFRHRYGDGFNQMGDNLPYLDLGTVNGLGVTPLSVTAIAGNCAIVSGGGVKCWGENGSGQLGRGNNTGANGRIGNEAGEMGDNLPYVDLGTHDGLGVTNHTAKAISTDADQRTYCVILDDDRVKCWGEGEHGKLGSGNTNNLGDNIFEMGDFLPYVDLGTGRTAKQISNGCAILDNDGLKCWGLNNNYSGYGFLGLGDSNNRGDSPNEMGDNLPYVNLGTHNGAGLVPHTAKQVSRGFSNICAVLDDNRLKCWGTSFSGELGLGLFNTSIGDAANEMGDNLPYVNLGTGRTALQVRAGNASTIVVRDNGSVVGFGNNSHGQLGRGDTVQIGDSLTEMGDALVPVNLGTGLTAVKITSQNSSGICALLSNAQIKCWGYAGAFGADGTARFRLGVGDSPGEVAAVADISLPTGRSVRQLQVGFNPGGYQSTFTAILDNGAVTNWGFEPIVSGGGGGDRPSEMGNSLPQGLLAGGRTALKISANSASACAIDNLLDMRCWASASYAGLKSLNGTSSANANTTTTVPIALIGTGRKVVDVSTGSDHACALLDNLSVKCWGESWAGQLGYGDTLSRGNTPETSGDNLPAVDLGTVSFPVQISTGYSQSCARFANGGVKCWGWGYEGQLGQGHPNNVGDQPGEMGDSLPFIDLGTGRTAKSIVGSLWQTCVILDTGNVVCWGTNDSGQNGTQNTTTIGSGANQMGDNLITVNLNGDKAVSLSAEYNHVCALLENNSVKCWGNNYNGQLGQGDTNNRGDGPGELGAALPAVPITW